MQLRRRWPKARAGLVAVEALVALVVARLMLIVMPFQTLARLLGPYGDPGATRHAVEVDGTLARARAIGARIDRSAAVLPWLSSCLVRVIAGRLMLRRRGIRAVARFGVTRAPVMAAHAWLLVGGEPVLGGRHAGGFTPIADFYPSAIER